MGVPDSRPGFAQMSVGHPPFQKMPLFERTAGLGNCPKRGCPNVWVSKCLWEDADLMREWNYECVFPADGETAVEITV